MRRADGIDYSQNVIEFLARREPRAGAAAPPGAGDDWWAGRELHQRRMEDTRLDSIRLRPGHATRYLYVHHGCVEHKIVIADVRLAHDSDVRERSMYPVTTLSRRSFYTKGCCICDRKATWVEHVRVPVPDTSYFCDECHRLMHCRADGSLKMVASRTVTPYL